MNKAIGRSVVVLFFALAGCAVTGDAPSSTEPTVDEPSSQVVEQGVTSCPLACKEVELVCQGSCPKDPFNPQNDCGCRADYNACLLTCH